MYRTVSRKDFSAIQNKLFPVYFGMQVGIPAFMALTFPGNTLTGLSDSIYGLLDPSVRLDSLVPIATIFVAGLVNLVVLLPMVSQVMKDRMGQGELSINLLPVDRRRLF